MPMRLFAAIELDDAARVFMQRAAELVASAGVSGRFESPAKFHITLAFLGATPDEKASDVVRALRAAGRLCAPFDLQFDSIGAFPNESRPRVIWVGPSHIPNAFDTCAEGIFQALALEGWELDRKPHAHVTVCRTKTSASVRLPRLTTSTTVRVAGVTLYESLPAGPSTRYNAIERVPFA